jgi:hypothetical protein
MSHALTAADAALHLSRRLRIIQTIEAILEQPPSHDLKEFIDQQLQREQPKSEMASYLRLLTTDNEVNRVKAREALKILTRQVQEEQAAVARGEDPGLIMARHQPKPSGERQVLAAEIPEGVDPQATVNAAIESYSKHRTADVVSLADHSRRSNTLQPAGETRGRIPFRDAAGALEVVRYTMKADNEVRDYSIITSDTTVEHLGGQQISKVVGVIVGIEGQRKVEHGFGFVLNIPGDGILLNHEPGKRNIIQIGMSYPGTTALFDDHEGPRLGGISHFMTLHESMTLGYRYLLDLEIVPIQGRYAFSIKPHQFIERYENGQPSRISSAHLRQLSYACEKLGFIGMIGEVDVS